RRGERWQATGPKSASVQAWSHDLRTPLNAIGGYAQLIEMGVRGPVTEAQRVDLLKIQRSKDHLDSLVADVLNFAKVGSGRIELRLGPVDVRKTIDALLDMVTPQLAQKQLNLAPFVAPLGVAVVADADKTLQILVNLF